MVCQGRPQVDASSQASLTTATYAGASQRAVRVGPSVLSPRFGRGLKFLPECNNRHGLTFKLVTHRRACRSTPDGCGEQGHPLKEPRRCANGWRDVVRLSACWRQWGYLWGVRRRFRTSRKCANRAGCATPPGTTTSFSAALRITRTRRTIPNSVGKPPPGASRRSAPCMRSTPGWTSCRDGRMLTGDLSRRRGRRSAGRIARVELSEVRGWGPSCRERGGGGRCSRRTSPTGRCVRPRGACAAGAPRHPLSAGTASPSRACVSRVSRLWRRPSARPKRPCCTRARRPCHNAGFMLRRGKRVTESTRRRLCGVASGLYNAASCPDPRSRA